MNFISRLFESYFRVNFHLGYAGNSGLFPIITNEKLPKRASKKSKLSFVATNKLFQGVVYLVYGLLLTLTLELHLAEIGTSVCAVRVIEEYFSPLELAAILLAVNILEAEVWIVALNIEATIGI